MPTKPNSVSQKVLGHLEANPKRPISYDELGDIPGVPRDQVPIAINGLLNNNIHVRKIGDKAVYLPNPYPAAITQRWLPG